MSILRADWISLREAVDTIRKGYIVAYPTETFYGLGVDPFNRKALERLFALKGRERGKPVPVLVPDLETLEWIVEEIPKTGRRLIDRFWPGPLTIVFKARPEVPDLLTGGTGKIGVRISSHPVAAKLLEYLDGPLTTTSANPSGKGSPLTAGEVEDYFGEKVAIIIDGGRLKGRKGSTVVDVTGGGLTTIREGEISVEELRRSLEAA